MRRSRFQVVAAAAMAFSLLLITAVFADEVHGDELSDIRPDGSLDLGTVCAGEDATGTLHLAIRRQSNGAPQIYANGTTVSIAPTGGSAGLTAGAASGTISIPSDWSDADFGTWSSSVTATVTLNTATPGAFSGSVTYESTALNQNGDLRTFDDSIPVTATVETCVVEVAPTVDYTLNPAAPDGTNGWYQGDVSLTWDVTGTPDPTLDGCENQLVTTDQVTTFSCTAANSAGIGGPVEVEIKRDGTAPTVAHTLDPAAPNGDNDWYTSKVTATFTATDNLSGFDAAGTLTHSEDVGSGAAEGAAVQLSSPAFTDWAGNTVAAGPASADVKIDLTDPYDVAFVGGPADGASYVFASVPGAPTCTADDDVSGLAGCVVTGYDDAVGTHTLTATATDNAGRTATAQRTYTVLAWTLDGFHRPVDLDKLNTVKAGSTVPLKFNVFAGDTELTDTNLAWVGFAKVNCAAVDEVEEVEGTTTGGTSYRYDTKDGQFIYNWQTPKAGAGSCFRVTLQALDGSTQVAQFRLK